MVAGSPDSLSVEFDSKVFSITTIKKAAYRYINVFAADIRVSGDVITCVLTASELKGKTLSDIAHDFRKEVLDQDLRETLKAEPIRNVILAHAFSKTGLIADEQVPKD
jgi:His-Xaa-Ser system protein HxsD